MSTGSTFGDDVGFISGEDEVIADVSCTIDDD